MVRPRLVPRASLAAAGAMALLAAGCGGGVDHQYVANQDLGVYYRLPESWRTFDASPIMTPQQNQIASLWSVVFDARAAASSDALSDVRAADPVGRSTVLVLPAPLRGYVHQEGGLRTLLFGLSVTLGDDARVSDAMAKGALRDPLVAEDEGLVEVVELEEGLVTDEGMRGTRLVVKVGIDEDAQEYLTVSTTGFVDPSSTLLYVMTVGCESSCYDGNARRIDDLLSSWKVETPA